METGFFFLLIPLDAFDIQVSSESRLSFQEARDLSGPCGSQEPVQFLVLLLCECLFNAQICGIFLIETRRSGFI